MAGRLVVVATPIGNLGDLSPRAREALESAAVWLVEDTRVSGKLQTALGVRRPMKVLNDHTTPRIVASYAAMASAQTVAVLSDAGSPGVSDPGAELVDLALESGIEVDCIPGPSAVTASLALAGFYAQRFAFLGFLSRKRPQAVETLAPFAESPLTLVMFESPYRLADCLEACAQALGSRRFAVCRELTKIHQQVWRGTLPVLPDEKEVPRKGEVTIVVEGYRRKRPTEVHVSV